MLLAAVHRIAGGASGEHIVFAFYKRASQDTNAARRAASLDAANRAEMLALCPASQLAGLGGSPACAARIRGTLRAASSYDGS
jgi:hypothetical protein